EYALARRLLNGAINSARAASTPAALPWLLACRSQLDYRTGRWRHAYAEAFEAAQLADETGQGGALPFALSSLGLIEAAEGREAGGGAARCRVLLGDEQGEVASFCGALRWQDRTPPPFERARTQLCRGERLRRSGRRVEARGRLRSALATFESLGAATWAER